MQQYIPIILGLYLIYFLWSKRSSIYYKKGIKEINNRNYEKGLHLLEVAVSQGVKPMQEIRAAYAALKVGDVKKARTKLNMVLLNRNIKENFKNEAKCILAIVCVNQGEVEEAREILDKLHKTYKNTNFYATFGFVAILTGDREYYTKINEEAYDYNKDSPVICDNYAHTLYLNGEFDQSEELYQAMIEKTPNFPEAYFNYALVLIEKNNIEKAVEMLESALTKEFFGITTIKREQVEVMLNKYKKEQ
jgi:tetratricopeptide (TPR) repeat protein